MPKSSTAWSLGRSINRGELLVELGAGGRGNLRDQVGMWQRWRVLREMTGKAGSKELGKRETSTSPEGWLVRLVQKMFYYLVLLPGPKRTFYFFHLSMVFSNVKLFDHIILMWC